MTDFSPGEAETLLVVDDDEAIRKLEVRILSKLGHKVLEAGSPMEAMQLAAATPAIRLLLTDFSMPGFNGLELARRFRAVHPKAPVLMVSGAVPVLDGETRELEGFAVLAKPFTSVDLLRTVRTLMDGSTSQAADGSP